MAMNAAVPKSAASKSVKDDLPTSSMHEVASPMSHSANAEESVYSIPYVDKGMYCGLYCEPSSNKFIMKN